MVRFALEQSRWFYAGDPRGGLANFIVGIATPNQSVVALGSGDVFFIQSKNTWL